MNDGHAALELVGRAPWGERLLAVLELHPEARLVGGAVRDLLRGAIPHEVDVVVEGDPRVVAEAIGTVRAEHPRFGTLSVDIEGTLCDVAMSRTERYDAPGALPEVAPAALEDDLLRRDFTINAITLAPGHGVVGLPGALEDLEVGRLSVLHPRSFIDDPTRLWRLVRYAVRFGFLPTTETDVLAHRAVADRALETVSADRRTAELRILLQEPHPLSALHAAQQLGLLSGLKVDPEVAEIALALIGERGSVPLTTLGSCVTGPGWGTEFSFEPAERRVLDRCGSLEPLGGCPPLRPSEVVLRLGHEPLEAVAVAGARGDASTARHFIEDWSALTTAIGGEDLIAAGIAQGPELGRILAATRAALLDGRLAPGKESELAFALGENDGVHYETRGSE